MLVERLLGKTTSHAKAGCRRKLEELKLRVQTACEEPRFLHEDSPAGKQAALALVPFTW